MVRHLLTIKELSNKEVEDIVSLASEMKSGKKKERLQDKTLIMLFEKASTRTRVSFEAGITRLGGHAIFMDFKSSQISRGETMYDTGRVLSRYGEIMMARLFKHTDIMELARGATVPVINGLTDLEHPCQALCDLLTMREKGKGKGKFAYIGDCRNNMAHSLLLVCAKAGMEVTMICPPGYEPAPEYLAEAKKHGGEKIKVENDPAKGAKGADVIYTDVWVSMGMESEQEQRMRTFKPYQVNSALLKHAKPDCIVMHCLPAHRELEITSEVLDGKHSVVWDQAENRLHIQNAIMVWLLKK